MPTIPRLCGEAQTTEDQGLKHVSEYLAGVEAHILLKGLPLFRVVAETCLRNKKLVAEFDRLNGTNLSRRGTTIELMVDEATGKYEVEVIQFLVFVKKHVWDKLPQEFFDFDED